MDTNDNVTRGIQSVSASLPIAYIVYCPKTEISKEYSFYNEEAWRVLSLSNLLKKTAKGGRKSPPDISALCMRWKGLWDKTSSEKKTMNGNGGQGTDFIEVFQSYRRQYSVSGAILINNASRLQVIGKQYLFVLERICPDNLNFSRIYRLYGLNQREQEIVQLLLNDRSNKEIAKELGLSLNMIKGYMKLLTRKLGVSTKTGIIAIILTGKSRRVS